jgi:hypothetical protein
MSAEKSASAVVLPINTQKLVNSFNFSKMVNFLQKIQQVTKRSKYENQNI